ncbi:hypothetical protein AURDEDRAFT_113999 [Auricularia subglabra TFB-10046 SS5]|nr:hypothetical protein AURDEDRAFT_113999 [Auricularia subglabra TFB-10046 SS5]
MVGAPQVLMRPRGAGTGSIFHETGIWPPPGAGSRLQDPLLSASAVELGSIVDDVMGAPPQRLRGGNPSSASDSVSMENPFRDDYERAGSPDVDSPAGVFVPGHARSSSGTGSSSVHAPLLGAAIPPHARFGSQRGSRLALVTPESVPAGPSTKVLEASSSSQLSHGPMSMSQHGHSTLAMPGPAVGTLVDLSPGQEAEMRMPAELPPQYHTIRRDTATSAGSARSSGSVYSDVRSDGPGPSRNSR